MNSKKDLLAYTLDYVSFIIYNISPEDFLKIRNIMLFGSVARGDFGKSSDIDLFFDVVSDNKMLEKKIEKITKGFFDSTKFREYWKMLNIPNKFRLIVGRLEEWGDLRESIISNGILLFGHYKELPEKKTLKVIIQWDKIGDETKRVHLNKRLFGFRQKGREYSGLLKVYGGEKLGTRCIIVPIEAHRKVLDLFIKLKVRTKTREVIQ